MHTVLKMLVAVIALSASLTGAAFANTIVKTGAFVAGDVGHGGAGTASIVQSDAGATLEIEALKTDPGPDLRVILIKAENAVTSPLINQSEYIILGDLQSTTGDQSYEIPAGTDTSEFNTVAIWCEEFSVLFIAAPLH